MLGRSIPFLRSRGRHARIAVTLALVGAVCGFSSIAQAQSYPSQPIRLVVGFAPGGPTDILGRIIGHAMSKDLGEQIIVENRTGAGGNIAAEAVARAHPDGHTVLLVLSPNAVNETLFKNFKIRFDEHFEPIGGIADSGLVLLTHPSLGVSNVKELIALVKSKPGDFVYASAGAGSATHLAPELFNAMAGTKLMPVHYKGGGQTISDLLSGEVKLMFSTIPPVLPHVKEGRMKAIATTGAQRHFSLPDLPTISESGLPGFDVTIWFGLVAPKGTPKEALDRLSTSLSTVLKTEGVRQALDKQGFTLAAQDPETFRKFYQDEVAKWAKVLKEIGLSM